MPTPSEYADAVALVTDSRDDLLGNAKDLRKYNGPWSESFAQRADKGASAFTLALRWLRVGAALEAGTLALRAPSRAIDRQMWSATYTGAVGEAPDPLTAAERAMGVGNG